GTTVDAVPISYAAVNAASSTQVSAILPSNTPNGDGTLVLSFNNQPSAAFNVKVVEHSFGLYTLNSAGSGPAVMTDADYNVNFLTQSMKPGQVIILWGTGLGAVTGNEFQGPLPGDLPYDVKVYVGGKLANVLYRGRSGCCSGLDQIVVEIPQGVDGCYVPLVVSVDGVVSNFTTISVAANGGACSAQGFVTSQELQDARTRDSLRLGTIFLSHLSFKFSIPGLGDITFGTDSGSADFHKYDFNQLIRSQGTSGFSSIGSCSVFVYQGDDPQNTDPIVGTGLDAGNFIGLTGPNGPKQLTKQATGAYSARLGGGSPFGGDPLYLDPGPYTATGTGVTDVKAFTAQLSLPAAVTWSNQDTISDIDRSKDLLITWEGGDPSTYVTIYGASSIEVPKPAGAGFLCLERADKHQFSIPSVVLSALPATGASAEGIPLGFMLVGNTTTPARFPAEGLDVGLFFGSSLSGKGVNFKE
ncbi:MAG TPA: hypothetical protein VLE22_21215, partial [Bryobacteraceae bacterium]|nr:hypothetical protein [Bryobacteraceae bacterium]